MVISTYNYEIPFWIKCTILFLLQTHLFSKINIPESGILAIDSSLPADECAEDYTHKLKEVWINHKLLKTRRKNNKESYFTLISHFHNRRPSQVTPSLYLTCYCLVWDPMGTHVPFFQITLC